MRPIDADKLTDEVDFCIETTDAFKELIAKQPTILEEDFMKNQMVKERIRECNEWLDQLAEALKETHVIVGSCNKDNTRYLVPKGTEKEITYYGKPANSFRVSDHWNWKSSLEKCKNEHYIQCFSKDLPWAKVRNAEGKASKPITACCVMHFGSDKLYHAAYGECFIRETKEWTWVKGSISHWKEVAEQYNKGKE